MKGDWKVVFIDNVKEYCNMAGMTVAAFERKCDIANAVINGIERGRSKNPSIKTLVKIHNATGIDMSVWFKEGGISEYFGEHPQKVQGTGKASE